MNNAKSLAIAASAYNVCGPRTGNPATPATVAKLNRTAVVHCIGLYMAAHDGSLFSRAEIVEAREFLAA